MNISGGNTLSILTNQYKYCSQVYLSMIYKLYLELLGHTEMKLHNKWKFNQHFDLFVDQSIALKSGLLVNHVQGMLSLTILGILRAMGIHKSLLQGSYSLKLLKFHDFP